MYLNNFSQVAALESGLEVQVFVVEGTLPYPVLIPVAQMMVDQFLLFRGGRVAGRSYGVEIVHHFGRQQATVEATFHAGEKFGTADPSVLAVQRLVLSEAVATDQIRVSHLHETYNALHPARYHAISLLIRQNRNVFEYFDRRLAVRHLVRHLARHLARLRYPLFQQILYLCSAAPFRIDRIADLRR